MLQSDHYESHSLPGGRAHQQSKTGSDVHSVQLASLQTTL